MQFIKPKTIKYNTLALTIALTFVTGAVAAESKQNSIILAQTSTTVAKQDGKYWIDKGWELHREKKYEEAIQAWRKAEAMGAGSEDLTFDIASTYETMERIDEAYREVSKLKDSTNNDSRVEACEKMNNMRYALSKSLPKPYFADLSTTLGWQSIEDMTFFNMKGRLGVGSGGKRPAHLYLFGRYSSDNRSGAVGGFPVEYYTNEAAVGLGVNKKLLTEHDLYIWAEAGRVREFRDPGPDIYADDLRGGFEYSRSWNTEYNCSSTDKYPNRFILKTFAELVYYNRFDEAIWFSAKVRPGLRIYETQKATVDTMLVFAVNQNLDNSADNYNQAGVQIQWRPNREYNYTLSAKALENFYENGTSEFNFIVELSHYANW